MNNFLEELNAAIAEYEKNEYEKELTGDIEEDKYVINNDSMANYFCKLIKQLEEKINEINLHTDNEIEKIRIVYDNFRNEEVLKLTKQIDYYTGMLETYAYKSLEGTKKKSIKLPYGTLQIRKQQPEIKYEDEALEWLKENKPEYVTIKETSSINKTKLKKDGFINTDNAMYIDEIKIPGILITERPDKFEVK